MRGVYMITYHHRRPLAGSSPHARGLPLGVGLPLRTPRIIPACAGFTCARVCVCRCVWDHPRMRGVYDQLVGDQQVLPWIIPACAGFTQCHSAATCSGVDHPRMRGVYG